VKRNADHEKEEQRRRFRGLRTQEERHPEVRTPASAGTTFGLATEYLEVPWAFRTALAQALHWAHPGPSHSTLTKWPATATLLRRKA